MTKLPTISNYGQYSSDNYSGHTIVLEYGDIDLYFSYKTIVAFRTIKTGLVVSQNYWGPTTGKHLNWIDGGDKNSRLNADAFKAQLEAALSKNGFKVAA